MLVLSRKRDEAIMIGDDIELTIVDIRGDKVRIGIQAPLEVKVHRKEVYLAIQEEKEKVLDCGCRGDCRGHILLPQAPIIGAKNFLAQAEGVPELPDREQVTAFDSSKMPRCFKCGNRTSPAMFTDELGKHPCYNCGYLNTPEEVK